MKKTEKNHETGDVADFNQSEVPWLYSDIVKDHFFNPRNVLLDETDYQYDAKGIAGSPLCGDMMSVWLKVDPKTQKIADCKWRTFGCASAIAATSMMSMMVTEKGGMPLKKALNLKTQQILERLGGLPDRKYHCSVLGLEALKNAVNDYFQKQKS